MSGSASAFAILHLARKLSRLESVDEVAETCSRLSDDELMLASVYMGELQDMAREARVEAECRENRLLVFCVAMHDALRMRGVLGGDDDPRED